MIRYLFAALLLLHGLIHLLSFASQWQLKAGASLTEQMLFPITAGVSTLLVRLWLMTCLIFVLVAIGYLFRLDGWPALAVAAVVLSQTLIIFYRSEAKAGTLVNLLITSVLTLSYAHNQFDQTSDAKVQQMLD